MQHLRTGAAPPHSCSIFALVHTAGEMVPSPAVDAHAAHPAHAADRAHATDQVAPSPAGDAQDGDGGRDADGAADFADSAHGVAARPNLSLDAFRGIACAPLQSVT